MKIMSIRKAVLLAGLAGSIAVTTGCAPQKSEAATAQTARVVRGNLTTDIVAGGNLELAQKEDLAFQVAGTVAEILVRQEDAVQKGQVIARLDTSTLEDDVKTAERAVATAEVNLADAENGDFKIKTAEYELETATMNFNKLNYPYTYNTFNLYVPAAIEDLNAALKEIDEADKALKSGNITDTWATVASRYTSARTRVTEALESLTLGRSIDTWSSSDISKAVADYQEARSALIAMERAENNLVQTKRNVQSTLDNARIALDKANDDLSEAREDLANAVLTAPFDGFITKVSVEGGDEIQKGTVAVQLADPARFKTTIMVGETDVVKLREGMEASIQIDSMPTVILTAKVTQISPTANIQSGVVNYEVAVEADSIRIAGPSSPGNTTPVPGAESQTMPGKFAEAITTDSVSELREGMTVTLNITVSGKKDILLVPGQAIQRSGKGTQVQVMRNGAAETRDVTTGISNWQFTEIIEGLEEGEEVVIQTAVATGQNQRFGQTGGFQQGAPVVVPGGGVVIKESNR